MRLLVSITLYALIGVAFAVTGCANSSTNPNNPVSPPMQTTNTSSEPGNRYLWGVWKVTIDPATLQTTAVPIRSVADHWNARKWLENGPCTNCVKVTGVENIDDHVIHYQVEIKHPYTNPNLTGFDVRGIAIFNEGWTFDASGLTIPTQSSGKGCLLNPDGYTRLYVKETAGQGPGGLQGYSKGKFASVIEPTATLNGYLRYNSSGAANTRCALYTADTITREYQIAMPESPNPFVFGYAVDSSWAPPVNKPVDDPMTDFGPEANCQEPWKIETQVMPIGQGLDSGGGSKGVDRCIRPPGIGLSLDSSPRMPPAIHRGYHSNPLD